MTTVVVLVDPPREGLVLPQLLETSPITRAESVELYKAMVKDILHAVHGSGGELLINYRSDDDNPDQTDQEYYRTLAQEALPADVEPRFEVQVGSTASARVGNTITYLLTQENVASAAVIPGPVPLLNRTHVDNAAMRLRRSNVVLGPATDGSVYYAGFTDPIDFTDAFNPPEVQRLTELANDNGFEVDFLPQLTTVATGRDFRTVVAHIRARALANRVVPTFTTRFIDSLGLRVIGDNGDRKLVRS